MLNLLVWNFHIQKGKEKMNNTILSLCLAMIKDTLFICLYTILGSRHARVMECQLTWIYWVIKEGKSPFPPLSKRKLKFNAWSFLHNCPSLQQTQKRQSKLENWSSILSFFRKAFPWRSMNTTSTYVCSFHRTTQKTKIWWLWLNKLAKLI